MNPYLTNFEAYKYAESVSVEFVKLCGPLFKLPINVFAYFRFFNDGRYLYLCNDLKWVEFCLQNVHSNNGTSLGQEISHVPKDHYHAFLWPTRKTDYLMDALYEHDIWHGLSIFKQCKDSIELWGFATDRTADETQMYNFYLENIELLKDFTAMFNINAARIIAPKPKNLAIYKDFKSDSTEATDQGDKTTKKFIESTPINKHPIITDLGEVFLTNKEIECVNLLSSGKVVKEIANTLASEPRTIEKHLENIKNKFGCKKKSHIIEIYKNSVLNWL